MVRSTLAAEAYAMSETSEGMDWCRTIMAELLFPLTKEREKEAKMKGIMVTDAKSLYDVIVADRVNVQDRRLSLEASLLREVARNNVSVKWVRSEQMLADCLTKAGVDTTYLEVVLDSSEWTLGPDPRAPQGRKSRPLQTPAARPKDDEKEVVTE